MVFIGFLNRVLIYSLLGVRIIFENFTSNSVISSNEKANPFLTNFEISVKNNLLILNIKNI